MPIRETKITYMAFELDEDKQFIIGHNVEKYCNTKTETEEGEPVIREQYFFRSDKPIRELLELAAQVEPERCYCEHDCCGHWFESSLLVNNTHEAGLYMAEVTSRRNY